MLFKITVKQVINIVGFLKFYSKFEISGNIIHILSKYH